MFTLYQYIKNFYKSFHFIDLKNVYPFEMMDTMLKIDYTDSYTTQEEFEYKTPLFLPSLDKNIQIVQKICESIQLDNNDYIYLESLSKLELMKFVRLYNDNLHK